MKAAKSQGDHPKKPAKNVAPVQAAPTGEFAIATFRLNGKLIESGNEMVREFGLSTSSWQLLGAIASAGTPLTVAQIARNMGLQRQSVQRTANMAEERGLVAFLNNPNDRRAQLVSLTKVGKAALDAASARERAWARHLTEFLDPDRVRDAIDLIVEFSELLNGFEWERFKAKLSANS